MEDHHTRETALRLAQDAVLTLREAERSAEAIVERAEVYLRFLRGEPAEESLRQQVIQPNPKWSPSDGGTHKEQNLNHPSVWTTQGSSAGVLPGQQIFSSSDGNTEMRTAENIGIGVGIPYLRGGPFA